ncbi:tRNA(Met) cytidine acetate ligase [Parablautia muri]|nr:nucleotidyltransferase family protein [Parablautia muri]
MKTAAIIAEYNPFHNGHLYQIKETRRQTGADFILVVMSGDFVQRGGPAFCDKYIRTRMALACGADVVIELPALYALSSAEFFAGGAVALLEQLKVIDALSFGSESGQLSAFTDCARLLVQNPSRVHSKLERQLKSGFSYPAALERAVTEMLSENDVFSDRSGSLGHCAFRMGPAEIHALFSFPNNILGLEYCKSLFSFHNPAGCSRIIPFTLKRLGGGYHDLSPKEDAPFLSASAIRHILGHGGETLQKYVPHAVYDLLSLNNLLTPPVTENHFSSLLHYKLISERDKGFTDYLDCDGNLSDKICKNIDNFTRFDTFCSLLKSKDITYTRISRVLMHILLNIKTPQFFKKPLHQRNLLAPYARLLGFRSQAAPLLHAIKKSSAIPLLSKPADARFLLNEEAYALLQQDFFCACVYESIAAPYRGRPPINEIKQSPIITA